MIQVMKYVFCIDTSAFVDLHQYYGYTKLPEIWEEMDKLFAANRIISHKIVFDELTTQAKKPSYLSKWITSKQIYFRSETGFQAKQVATIIAKFPRLIDPFCEKEQADPWLIALAIEENTQTKMFPPGQEVAVVSQENTNNPNRIPAVCKYFSVKHLNLDQFFKENEWELKLEIT